VCFQRGWTVHGVIGVGGQCMVLSAWVDSAWRYRSGWTVHGIIDVGEQLVVHVL
jgi:hypothetical protein